MPYFVTNSSAECSGWAVVKDDGEVMGCHQTKADAVDQMIAISLEEGIEPGGEREARELPDNYRPAISGDVPDGRACGNCLHYNEDMVNEDGVRVWCNLWEDWVRGDHYCNRWEPAARYDKEDDDEERQVELNVPEYIRTAAARGLELRADGFGGDGLVPRTIREARLMAAGEISEDKVIRANAWGERHAVDLEAPQNSDADHDDWPGNGAVAHYLWGINPLNPGPARDWFARKAEQIKAERSGNSEELTEKETIMDDKEFRFEAPKDNLVRQVEFRAEPSNDGLTLEGYAAVFNEWTEIDSYEGTFQERIAPGAFKKTISERMPVLQFDHGTHPLIGSIPLGVITNIKEDAHGLRVKARLSDNWLVEPVRDAIRDGSIQGMSFRFRVINEMWARGKNGPERTITEVALYEAGPVVFPAYEQTSVGVRSREILTSLTDPEVRGEIAKLLAFGTDPAAETTEIDEPQEHSTRTKAQRQAIARLKLQKENYEDH
ncbi:MAG: HK97 family phage prohead protease [Ilumatobacteraceae bacterium]